MPKLTLRDALDKATRYWDAKGRSSRMMATRARVCVDLLGGHLPAAGMGPEWGTELLTGLAKRGLARGSQGSYYAAFRRMLALNGIATTNWPAGPTGPRRVREAIPEEELTRLIAWFEQRGWPETADLARLLRGTGMRADVEALNRSGWYARGCYADAGHLLRITGKGGHERQVPISPELHNLIAERGLAKTDRVKAMQALTYSGHLKRWRKGVKALGIEGRLPTPHAVRHLYATKAYERSGRNLRVVQELLGHAKLETTGRYIGVDMAELRAAVE